MFQTGLYSSEEEMLLHSWVSVHAMYVYIAYISAYKHSKCVFPKTTGMDVSGHMHIHPEQSFYTFVFIEWALYRAKFPLLSAS